jgi:hypothetical protein
LFVPGIGRDYSRTVMSRKWSPSPNDERVLARMTLLCYAFDGTEVDADPED